LFVDDEWGIRHTLPVILRQYGFTVTVAATVAEALSHIDSHSVDLLLCDLNLERELDGFDVVRAVRNS
jgi:DNA-binding response OmpR family regulator